MAILFLFQFSQILIESSSGDNNPRWCHSRNELATVHIFFFVLLRMRVNTHNFL